MTPSRLPDTACLLALLVASPTFAGCVVPEAPGQQPPTASATPTTPEPAAASWPNGFVLQESHLPYGWQYHGNHAPACATTSSQANPARIEAVCASGWIDIRENPAWDAWGGILHLNHEEGAYLIWQALQWRSSDEVDLAIAEIRDDEPDRCGSMADGDWSHLTVLRAATVLVVYNVNGEDARSHQERVLDAYGDLNPGLDLVCQNLHPDDNPNAPPSLNFQTSESQDRLIVNSADSRSDWSQIGLQSEMGTGGSTIYLGTAVPFQNDPASEAGAAVGSGEYVMVSEATAGIRPGDFLEFCATSTTSPVTITVAKTDTDMILGKYFFTAIRPC